MSKKNLTCKRLLKFEAPAQGVSSSELKSDDPASLLESSLLLRSEKSAEATKILATGVCFRRALHGRDPILARNSKPPSVQVSSSAAWGGVRNVKKPSWNCRSVKHCFYFCGRFEVIGHLCLTAYEAVLKELSFHDTDMRPRGLGRGASERVQMGSVLPSCNGHCPVPPLF